MESLGKVYFVSGIDTGIGKTFATGMLAKAIAEQGKRVITQKMVQTGCVGSSEDIEMHRQLQGIALTEEDRNGWTCPFIFSYPCSPHMAADRDGRSIDYGVIAAATKRLQERYDYVLLEGAGGLMVPTDHHRLTIDYVREHNYPVLLVTNGRLGSINHTLLNVEICRHYDVPIAALIYNLYPEEDAAIRQNTLDYLKERYPSLPLILLPEWTEGSGNRLPDVSALL